MYCWSCGADSVEGLRYCKRCGANLNPGDHDTQPRKVPLGLTLIFLLLIGFVFFSGLVMPSLVASEFAQLGFSRGDLMVLFMADIALTLGVVALLVWLFLRLIGNQGPAPVPRFRGAEPLPAEQPRVQTAGPEQSIASVTENTTRTLEGRRYDTPRSIDRVERQIE